VADLNAPVAFGGTLSAVPVLAPEAKAAIKSAIVDRLQRSDNICLRAVLATIRMTVPTILLIGILSGRSVALGLAQLIRFCL
jgi:Ca2+:H+ antiporter